MLRFELKVFVGKKGGLEHMVMRVRCQRTGLVLVQQGKGGRGGRVGVEGFWNRLSIPEHRTSKRKPKLGCQQSCLRARWGIVQQWRMRWDVFHCCCEVCVQKSNRKDEKPAVIRAIVNLLDPLQDAL